MAYQKLNYAQALAVIPSDDVRIPDPNSLILSLANETGDFTKADLATIASGGLEAAGINPGAIVYNTTDGEAYWVVEVIDDQNIRLSGGAIGTAGAMFNIYNRQAEACNLYTGGLLTGNPGPTNPAVGGDLTVVMAEQNHSSESLICACLLHDYGHFIIEDPDYFVAIDNFRQTQNNLKTLS